MRRNQMARIRNPQDRHLLLAAIIAIWAVFLILPWKADAAVLGKDIREGDLISLESGNWTETYVVLSPDTTNIGTVGTFLMLDGYKDRIMFDENGSSNLWEGSTAQKWCTRYYQSLPNDISSRIIGVKTTDTESGSPWLVVSNLDGTKTAKDKVFFLSGKEYMEHSAAADHSKGYNWLLRSPGADCSEYQDYIGVACNGSIHNFSIEHVIATRPAFNIDLGADICVKDKKESAGVTTWEVDVGSMEHQLETPEYIWSKDGTKCVARAKCTHCGDEVTETGSVSQHVIKEATDTEKGIIQCTARFKNKDFNDQKKDFEQNSSEPGKDPDTPSHPEKPDRKPGSIISTGDYVYLGNDSSSGYQGMPLWHVLSKEPDGTLLLMSEYLWSGDGTQKADPLPFNKNRADENHWQNSMARIWCQNFEQAVLGNIEDLKIYETTKSDAFTKSPDNITIQYDAVENALNRDRVFFLSAEEVLKYLPEKADRIAYNSDGEKIGKADSWWTRSPRYQSSVCSGRISSTGEMQKHFVDELSMARPVFRGNLDKMYFVQAGTKNHHSVWATENSEVPADVLDKASEPTKKPTVEALKSGKSYKVDGASYRVISADKRTAALAKAKNTKSVSVPATIKISGKSCKVVQLNGKAFTGKRIRTVTVGKNVTKLSKNTFAKSKATKIILQTRSLKKSSVKACFKSSKVKTVQVKVGSRMQNKKMVKTYKKVFTRKNCGKKVTVK